MERDTKKYYGYDYQQINVENNLVSMYLDGYESFGWEIDENRPEMSMGNMVTINMKRDRKIMNKTELTRLQRQFDDGINQLNGLEKAKTSLATAVSIAVGVIGTAFVAGSVFAVTNDPPIIWLCVLLAIPGFIGWASSYLVYKRLVEMKTKQIIPLMEKKRDEIFETCEKGQKLLEDI